MLPEDPFDGASILIVDDQPINQRLLKGMLSRFPCEIRLAANGVEALASVSQTPVSLILMDAMMPTMDGFEATRRLKSDPATAPIPILIVTALDDRASRHRGLESGAEDFLSKPIDRAELTLKVCNLLKLKQQGDLLQRQRAALERSNKELEHFAHIVSHDLQAPLRHIKGLTRMLERKIDPLLDDEGRKLIGRLQGVSARMQSFIDDLLSHARVGTGRRQVETVSIEALMESLSQEFSEAFDEVGGTLEVGPMPPVEGSPRELRQLFQNLLDNALKYRSPHRSLRVSVEAAPEQGAWRFCVQDNGLGVDEAMREEIFEMFARGTVGDPSRQSTGIGLALCRKIVDHHGGKIWVESQSDQSTSFYFTMPTQVGEAP